MMEITKLTYILLKLIILVVVVVVVVVVFVVTVKESRNRPGVAQRDPGGLGSQISITFCT
jgi:heme/copper-type cytochrome/quinol oxidase subunit 2